MKKIYIFFALVVLFGLGSGIVALAQTTTFSETGSVQTYTVPAGATAITVDAYGAQGGGIQCGGAEEYQSKGGCGGRVKATISVTPGHVLNIVVGGHGGVVSGTLSSGAAGYGGGGADAYYNTTWPSAGGGGGSFIIDATAGDTLLVAGGGGGGGGDFCSTSFSGSYGDNGGAGGGSTGGAGNANLCGTGAGGKGGTQTAGGAGSTCSSYTGAAGGFGHGGSSPATGTAGEPSAGGGGGRYGGGSGADGSGGGGGSSYINSLYLVAIIDTVQGANCPVSPSTTPVNGSVTISVACSPGIITGADSVCTGSTITLTDTASGGTWSVTNPTFATISATGEVTALSPGTDTVEYTVTGCFALLPLAVDLTPTVAVSGAATICYGGSTNINFTGTPGATVSYNINGGATLTETIGAGGTATVGTGVLDSNVTYGLLSVSNGSCTTPASGSVLISVLPVAHTITGDSAVCAGLTTVLADTPSGGTWSDAGTGFATINPISGVAAGISAGTETITYTAPTSGCVSTTTLTINPSPAAITGSVSAVCVGSYLSLSVTPTTGGTWSTSPTAFATIDSLGGTLYGTSAGTTVVTYTLPPGGCTSTYTVTVNGLPSITGADSVCVGSSITLTGTPASGSWTSGSPDTASVTISGGSVSGVAAGTAKITYTLGTGCMTDTTILVNPTPVAITGGTAVCAGSALALADSPSGGTWSASPASFATIDPVSGVLTALSAGTELVTYSLPPGGCTSTLAITVNPLPAAITGADSVCVGLTTALVSGPTGGTWTSIPAATATVSATGVVRGISQGIADITYTLGTGCQQSYSVTVNPLPAAISGASAVCSGLSVVLSDDSLGGSWSVSPATVATITASGDLTGGTAGAATVVYTLPTGCIATDIVTVNPLPAPITGSSSVCYGLTTTLGETTPGGTWSSSDTLVASINAGGTVTGVAVGTATITYTLGTGCIETFTMTVNPLPDAILGASAVCVDGSITMSDLSAPGTWSTSPASVATITPTTGVLTGVLSGTVSVIFTLPTTCQITTTVTVNPLPAAIGGSLATCEDGGTTTLTDITMPGTWSISPASLATVDSTTGVVTGISAGLATVTYTLPFTGCYVAETFTVNPLPLPISGTPTVCVNATVTLHDGTFGGSWSSSPVSVATIGSSSGTVGGISAGTATVTYTLATGCDVFYTMTVDPLPASVITPLGDTMICPGGYVDLTANTGDSLTYQWYDGGPIAGAVASSYVATAAGVYEVRVRNGLGCTLLSAPVSVTINGDTAYISAAGNTTCSGSPLTLYANAGAGLSYQWQLNGSSITGAVGSTYNVTDSSGNYTVVVTNSTGCLAVSAAYSVTVNPVPVPTVTASGALTFCAGGSVTFTADTTGGSGYSYQWYSAPGGLISGADSNSFTTSATGSYWVEETNSDGCNGATIPANVIVVSLPDASITPSGPLTFCSGGNVILTAGSAGDSYQWYNDGVAIPGATNQSYTDTASGSFTVFVTGGAPTGCTSLTSAATTVLVVSTPEVIPLTSTTFCWGGGVTLTVNVVSATTGLTYRWYYDGSPIPGATSAVYTTSVPGLYSCLISDGSCNAATSTVPVTENPLPNPVVTFDGNTLHAQNYYVSYQWYENTTAVAGATDSTDIPSTDGNYAVAVTDTNGCQSVSDVYVLTAVLGAGNVAAMSEIKIYPNPAQTELHISAPYSVRVEISSIDGRQMLSREQAKDIDISGLANGIYMVMLYDGNGQLVKAEKLVKDGN